MISNSPKSLGQWLLLHRQSRNVAPFAGQTPALGQLTGKVDEQTILVPPLCDLTTDGLGNFRAVPIHRARSVFNLLPNATSAAAGKDDLYVSLGVGTEVVTRATKGGVNVKTQATSPATADDAMLTGLANNGTSVPLTAAAQPRLSTRVNLTQITLQLFSATLDQTFTAVDPTASGGDGAGFVFDPTGAIGGLAGTAWKPNWLMFQKINGVNTFVDTGIPVQAGVDYDLDVYYDVNLVPTFMLNNVVVGGPAVTGSVFAAGTSAVTLTALVGVKIIDAGTPVQHDFDVRYISVERFVG